MYPWKQGVKFKKKGKGDLAKQKPGSGGVRKVRQSYAWVQEWSGGPGRGIRRKGEL